MAKVACGVGSAHNKVTYLRSQKFLEMCTTMRAQVLYNFVKPNEVQVVWKNLDSQAVGHSAWEWLRQLAPYLLGNNTNCGPLEYPDP